MTFITLDGYRYRRYRQLVDETISWRCVYQKSKKCFAGVYTDLNENVLKTFDQHNHSEENEKLDAIKIYNDMKELARTSILAPVNIIAEKCSNINGQNAVFFPKIESMKRHLRSIRFNEMGYISTPRNNSNFLISKEFLNSELGSILFFDNKSDSRENRILVFVHPNIISILKTTEHVFADGSFHTAPKGMYQVFTLHALYKGSVLPMVFSLLPNKKKDIYVELFKILKDRIDGFYPKTILIDFELGIINAISLVFENSKLLGCNFHFSQAVLRKVNEKYKKEYTDYQYFKSNIQELIGLSKIKKDEVIYKFYEIAKNIPIDIAVYFESTYIGIYKNNMKVAEPMFHIEFWNIYDRKCDRLPTTNNYVEGWHNHFNSFVGNAHPNIYKFINKIKKEMDLINFKILKLNS